MEKTAEGVSYENYLSCHKCEENRKDYSSIMWKKICTYIMDKNQIVGIYLFFHKLDLWLEAYSLDDKKFIRVVDNDAYPVFTTKLDKDIESILSISPDVLEGKIKTWVLFS
jgi:hypothetical protein